MSKLLFGKKLTCKFQRRWRTHTFRTLGTNVSQLWRHQRKQSDFAKPFNNNGFHFHDLNKSASTMALCANISPTGPRTSIGQWFIQQPNSRTSWKYRQNTYNSNHPGSMVSNSECIINNTDVIRTHFQGNPILSFHTPILYTSESHTVPHPIPSDFYLISAFNWASPTP